MPTARCHNVYLLWAKTDTYADERDLIGIYTCNEEAEEEIVTRALAGKGLCQAEIVIAELHGDLQELEITESG